MKPLEKSSHIVHSSTKSQLDFSWVSLLHSQILPALPQSSFPSYIIQNSFLLTGLLKHLINKADVLDISGYFLNLFCFVSSSCHPASTSLSWDNSSHFSLDSHSSPISSPCPRYHEHMSQATPIRASHCLGHSDWFGSRWVTPQMRGGP